jgi:hypothetical protein
LYKLKSHSPISAEETEPGNWQHEMLRFLNENKVQLKITLNSASFPEPLGSSSTKYITLVEKKYEICLWKNRGEQR